MRYMAHLRRRSVWRLALLVLVLLASGEALWRLFGERSLPWTVALCAGVVVGVLLLLHRRTVQELKGIVQGATARAELGSLYAASLATWYDSSLAPLPNLTGYALTLDAANFLVGHLHEEKPDRVLEFGAGLSTLLIGKALQQAGRGHLDSVENDPEHVERVGAVLRAHGLEDWVTLVPAPLAPGLNPATSAPWYALPAPLSGAYDLVLVDGPSQAVGELSRYPALPAVHRHLAKGALVVLDDANRPQQQRVLERWTDEFRSDIQDVDVMRMGRRSVAAVRWGGGEAGTTP